MITLIKNATIVNDDKIFKSDMVLTEGKIVYIGEDVRLNGTDYETIQAKGLYAFPGGIDPHVHLSLPTPAGNSTDNFRSGSTAAIAGGTTTIMDFVTPHRGQSLIEALLDRKKEAENSLIDYGLHMGISEYNDKVAEEIQECIQRYGVTSFKAYLAYKNSIGINYVELEKLMQQLAFHNALLMVHCEDGDEIEHLQRIYLGKQRTTPYYHMMSRPENVESDAVAKVLSLVESTGCRTYLVHISAKKSIELIAEFKKTNLVYAETCPQYLLLDKENYGKLWPKSLKYVISPPLRNQLSREALWKNISMGNIDVIATDHCPFNTLGQKDIGLHDFTKIPSGAGGIEYRLPLLYTYGALAKKITMMQFVELTSAKEAKIFGLYPQKGKISIGSDADIVLWNPDVESKIKRETQFQHCDSNIYEGIEITGAPEYVFVKGVIAFKKGAIQENTLQGSFLQ